MTIECPKCKAALESKDKRCPYCRTPIKANANDIPQAEFSDADRDAFLKDRSDTPNGCMIGCMIFILLPIATATCLWLVL